MARTGRPKLEIDWNEFGKLCKIQSTLEEMAAWFNVSEDTVERRVKEKFGMNFADVYKQKKGQGKVSLRRKQWQVALKGHPTMLIYLGKQHLDQTDKVEHFTNYAVGPYED